MRHSHNLSPLTTNNNVLRALKRPDLSIKSFMRGGGGKFTGHWKNSFAGACPSRGEAGAEGGPRTFNPAFRIAYFIAPGKIIYK